MRSPSTRFLPATLAAILAVMIPAGAFAAPRVAVLSPENRTGDPRYDYIAGIAHGLILYDLSSSGMVELVERRSIDALLSERELSMSAIASPSEKAFEGIAVADWILAGEYVLLGPELRLTLKLVDVATSKVVTFSDSGATENLIHSLAESVIERLTGKRPSLAEEGRSRSILSLRDETPGVIALFSYLVDAKVYLDGEFAGYTTGDRRVPFIIEGVDPGVHEISTDLGGDFGVVKLPEVTFAPWKSIVRVLSGKRLTVSDASTHFNDQLYRLRQLVRESPKPAFDASGRYAATFPFTFTDRTGATRSGALDVTITAPSGDAGAGSCAVTYRYEGETRTASLSYSLEAEAEFEDALGLAEFSVSVSNRYGRVDLDVEVDRVDIQQGMHRDE
jgi:TolB-like protein